MTRQKILVVDGGNAKKPQPFHKGWRVQGFRPGYLAEREAEAVAETSAWAAHTEEQRIQALKDGKREPHPWSLDQFLLKAKRQNVRPEPYAIPTSAEHCAEMARVAGWECVEVVEIKRGEVGDAEQ